MRDRFIVITTVGPDRPGLISEISSVVANLGCNIEDIDQVVMKNIFVLSMVVRVPYDVDLNRFREKMRNLCFDLGLEVSFYYAGSG